MGAEGGQKNRTCWIENDNLAQMTYYEGSLGHTHYNNDMQETENAAATSTPASTESRKLVLSSEWDPVVAVQRCCRLMWHDFIVHQNAIDRSLDCYKNCSSYRDLRVKNSSR
jgi:hypothetical protein